MQETGFGTAENALANNTPANSTTLRSQRTLWRSFDEGRRADIKLFIVFFAIVGAIVGSVVATYQIKMHNARTQAVWRAQKMSGEIYTIKGVDFNWVGDTRLYLENDRGEDCGFVMMHMNNPFTSEVNPIYLTFAGNGYDNPFPMKVRTYYRQEAWTKEHVSSNKESFTGSFLTFEKLDK